MPSRNKNNTYAKVGIFMPYYNMGDYIEESLESLYSQTFQDFNVIIADDASPSLKSREKLLKIERARCSIYYERKNLGLIKISNKYMAMLNAEYIMLFSPDDKMHPDFLKEQVEFLDTHPDIQAVCTWIQEFGGDNRIIKYSQKNAKLPEMLVRNHFSGAALMRKEAWIKAGMHDTNKELYPNLDYDLWLSMLKQGFKLGTINKPLFYWRVVQDSLSHRVKPEQILTFKKALLKKYSSLYKDYFEYVISQDFEELTKFEKYYLYSEEGHNWLDKEYKRLTEEVDRLSKENLLLSTQLRQSIQKPYIRSILGKAHRYSRRTLSKIKS